MALTQEQNSPEPGHATGSVTYHIPGEALRGAVTTYYLVRVSGPGPVTDQIFPEWPNFRIILSGKWTAKFPDVEEAPVPKAGVTGALERAVWVTGTEGLLVGVGLMPQGWPQLTDKSADEFTNVMRPLADCLGPVSDELERRLEAVADDEDAIYATLDEMMAPLLKECPETALVAAAHAALQDPQVETVADWADAFDLSARQLERFSRRFFGLPPKRLLRRQRMLRTLAAMREQPKGTWSQSLDAQFTDQAHFIREFRYYMGMSPSAYLARHSPFMTEAWKRRKELLGSPVQVLQPPTSED